MFGPIEPDFEFHDARQDQFSSNVHKVPCGVPQPVRRNTVGAFLPRADRLSLFLVWNRKQSVRRRGGFACDRDFYLAAVELAVNTLTATVALGPYLAGIFAFGTLVRLAAGRFRRPRYLMQRRSFGSA